MAKDRQNFSQYKYLFVCGKATEWPLYRIEETTESKRKNDDFFFSVRKPRIGDLYKLCSFQNDRKYNSHMYNVA